MDDPINTHALRYATEATKVWLMDRYKERFPHYFDYAHIETRLATPEDYYIPPSLANKCIVVERTYFEEIACRRLCCFPFKDDWEPCTEKDKPHWVQIGDHLELACQSVCRDHTTLNTDWIDNRCIVSNPLKKALASMPEKLFDRASRHIYHGGLNVENGTLKLNAKYCEAYGLDFADDDCVQSGWQTFLEWLLGMTTTRAIRTSHVQPFVLNPPPVPNYLIYDHPPQKIRDAQSSFLNEQNNDEAFKEISESLIKDLGENISQWAVESFIRKKAPKLLTKSIDKIAAKLVIKHSLATSLKSAASIGLKVFGKGFNIVTTIFAIYDIIIAVIDSLDVNDYTKVLDKATVDKIDKALDYRYFEDGEVRPEMTPEYIWDNDLLKEDASYQFDYMAERIEEYLKAVSLIPSKNHIKRVNLFIWKKDKNWNKTIFLCITIVAVIFVILYVEWIDVWVTIFFFFKIFLNL